MCFCREWSLLCKVFVTTGNVRQRADVFSGGSYASTSDPRVNFGLGQRDCRTMIFAPLKRQVDHPYPYHGRGTSFSAGLIS
ncbi:MAG: ASPIC/UnbV domain-containing protein [Candidatus Sulfotelmatobacter sp.]